MEQRRSFIAAWLGGDFSISQLSVRYGISRKTAYKWIDRFKIEGITGLSDRSRARHSQAHRMADAVVEQVLALKRTHPDWGPKKLRSALYRSAPDEVWPAASTIGELLKSYGLVKPRRRRVHTPPYSQPLAHATAPNRVWSGDFKGQFQLGNGAWCYPLTLSDNYSRMLLACQGMAGPRLLPVRASYERAFREYGLPDRIRTDNGFPFAMCCLGGLTGLSIWLIRLGVLPERIAPGKPQQNGRHERMHRTLKAATASPPKGNFSAQQRAFNRFRQEYNQHRPHESLGLGRCPADVHEAMGRPYPERLPELIYPDHYAVRKVRCGGYIKLHGRSIYTTRQLVGEYIGLDPVSEDRWELYFGRLTLGLVDERLGRVIRPV
ncbi:MAG: integrase core domain-containing protein [Anaerolineae bacterium]|nr:integrase core domain-containing protein [Anaerolineae bacterium]